jgi:uncharacterized membrane protein
MFDHYETYNQIAGRKVQRTEALSDAIFAIAITILAFDVRLPLMEAVTTESQLFAAFGRLTPKFLTYFLSFLTLGIFWTAQSIQYTYILKSDRHLNWLNLFFLMFVTLVPFTTAFLSEHITFKFAIALYWFHLFCLGTTLLLHWTYAYKHGYVENNPKNLIVKKTIRDRIILAEILYALGSLLCFISPLLSISVIILIHLNFALAPFSRLSTKPHLK